ncbi:hypothetical protein D910_08263 [Dendroctonus ponderosae]|uniref:Uncharacterized protein n=1 Tax=Dendroctonus ponderosae TaxID=77166 RepID=U4UAI7_DENPD|nr:hypothetical protein D910_08263 [Dendroctonus ponderosae]
MDYIVRGVCPLPVENWCVVGGAMMSKPPTGFTPIPFATASLPSGQFLQTPIFYWPLYPSPPVSPTGYYMGPPPIGPLGQLHQAQQQRHPLIQGECVGVTAPLMGQSMPALQPLDAILIEARPRPISC